jgi:hypothetical protein
MNPIHEACPCGAHPEERCSDKGVFVHDEAFHVQRKKLRVIDALQLPEVLDGSVWFALPVPVLGTDRETTGHGLPTMTVGIDPVRGTLHYCDGTFDPRAAAPTHLGAEAALNLRMLLGACALVHVRKGPEW